MLGSDLVQETIHHPVWQLLLSKDNKDYTFSLLFHQVWGDCLPKLSHRDQVDGKLHFPLSLAKERCSELFSQKGRRVTVCHSCGRRTESLSQYQFSPWWVVGTVQICTAPYQNHLQDYRLLPFKRQILKCPWLQALSWNAYALYKSSDRYFCCVFLVWCLDWFFCYIRTLTFAVVHFLFSGFFIVFLSLSLPFWISQKSEIKETFHCIQLLMK